MRSTTRKQARPAPVLIGKMPAGDYYIGDPCYAIRDDNRWNSFCNALWAAEGEDEGSRPVVFEFEGHKCFVSATNTGDGEYRDNKGNTYGVDAGMIGAIPAALCGGGGVHFDKPFPVGADVGRWIKPSKRIQIGHLKIRT
jgi:hypothetical protein